MPSNHLILCCPLLFSPSIFPSIRVASGSQNIRLSASVISPSNEHPGLISFRMDWLDLLPVQETLKSLLQYHSSKASILWCSTFFIAQLSHPYMTTGKAIALTRQTFVGKIMSLLFNMLSRLVIAFLPRSKHLLISWLQSPSVDLPFSSDGKESACKAWDPGSIPGLGRSFGEGNGNPLQYSCLENPMDCPGGPPSMGSQRVGHNSATNTLYTIVTICRDFGAQENKACYCFHCFPMKWWDQMPWS